jgi:hypothetical protein
MTRGYLVNHLINYECYPDEDCDVPGVGQLWHNALNREACFVPYEDELALTTYCHIIYELKVDPPLECGYDSDYAVYISFRDVQLKQQAEAKRGN